MYGYIVVGATMSFARSTLAKGDSNKGQREVVVVEVVCVGGKGEGRERKGEGV
jgi:hypothetical protein